MSKQPTPIHHLYLHVPFCAVKCQYCAFYSEAGNARQMSDYVTAVLAEHRRWAGRLAPRTIFLGGGTPSLLPRRHLERLLAGLQSSIHAPSLTECTVECNPATVSVDKARLMRDHGVNRVSLGVQALDDALLEKLGRIHSRDAAAASYRLLRDAGFENINVDLMFGLPGQTIDHFRRTLDETIAWQPDHVSTYCLILEEDTAYWSLFRQGLLVPDEDQELAMYQQAIATLAAAGYQQYEVSNFARPGRQCAHNIAYWEGADYLGLGPSACSTIDNRRWQNTPDTAQYLQALLGPDTRDAVPPHCAEETLTPQLRAAERVAFGMRMNAGVPADLVQHRWPGQVAELLSADLVQWREGRLRPTRRGILFADEIASEFV